MLALLFAALLSLAAMPAQAAPRVPLDEREVLERLPLRPRDPAAAELRELRAAAAAAPADPAAAAPLARRYFALAMAEGDPRYVGYAQAALAPWADASAAAAEILVVHALLRQYRHDFEGALADLALAVQRDPQNEEAHAWRAAIHMVRADYPAAARACAALAPLTDELQAAGCSAYVEATTGKTRAAYARLLGALERAPQAGAAPRLWVNTRLAEMSARLGDAVAAERHFKSALALGLNDNFLLAAYADFLLEQRRPGEVVAISRSGRARTLCCCAWRWPNAISGCPRRRGMRGSSASASPRRRSAPSACTWPRKRAISSNCAATPVRRWRPQPRTGSPSVSRATR